jgi:saccharopine dehydrogenase-like NADP-dependent oxidoreductase
MRIFCLGGAGAITREAIRDLLDHVPVEQVTIGDRDEAAGRAVLAWLQDKRVVFRKTDVGEGVGLAAVLREYDLVMDGTPISVNSRSAALLAEAGVNAINLNGMSGEWEHHGAFTSAGKTFVPGFGMTPGVTNLMAAHGASEMDTVESVFISHGAFRPIAFSRAIAETTVVEYDPDLPTRTVFEDGLFVPVPPFARPKLIRLPNPFGAHSQYIIPHPEGLTLSQFLRAKGVRLIEVRGTWPPENMELLKVLYQWGMLRNPVVEVNGCRVSVLDAVVSHLLASPQGTTTSLYGYTLHVELVGTRGGQKVRRVFTSTHPASDGSIPDWAGLRAYTRSVGIPFAIGAQLILQGGAKEVGVMAPEAAFDPRQVFVELQKRGIRIIEEVEPAGRA